MKYLKAYLKAVAQIAAGLALVHFALAIVSNSFFAHYFVYLAVVAGVAGPIAEAVKK